ncbi:MAG: ribonuclease H-like domain-containing protein [Patescibacteria group bacterium]|nr:ribonuclease H-like domain-containing protein [Patescibacteria group bacterium]
MRIITFDIETKNAFQDTGSNDSTSLDISVVCLHDSSTGEITHYFEQDFAKMWPIFESADALVTFNGDHFDIPLLNKYYHGDLTHIKSIDLMVAVQKSLGRRIKLDTLAEATLGKKKSGNGLEAIAWWKNGELEKLVRYCKDDVAVTRELYEYMRDNKSVKYKDYSGIKELKIDISGWDDAPKVAMNFSLPF